MRHFINHTEENYLKAIFNLDTDGDKGVSTNSIAQALETKASSVTDMLKKLADKKLVSYKKYYGVKLTDEGKKVAIYTIRKHRLWEVFLVEQLNFSWDEVHEIAEQLEHIQSEELMNRLDDFLGNPKYDPHGDPIPNKNGIIDDSRETIKLSEATFNSKYQVVGVSDSSSVFLQYLQSCELMLGTEVLVEERYEFDGSIKIHYNNSSKNISNQVAENLIVKFK